jgi:hypothetical protein
MGAIVFLLAACRIQTEALKSRERAMSSVRVLVGTRKGAFILSADGTRKDWTVTGPFFAGWEIYHMKGSPVDQDRIYASQCSGWFDLECGGQQLCV